MSDVLHAVAAVAMVVLATQACSLKSDGQGGLGGIGGEGSAGIGFGGGGSPSFDASVGVSGSGGDFCGLCPAPPASMLSAFVSSCCLSSSACGFSAPGLVTPSCILPQRGIADPTCPALGPVNGVPMPGCCAATGRCGVTLDALGLGCVARSDLSPVGIGTFNDPLALLRCGHADTDAGSSNAGDLICASARGTTCDPIAICNAESGYPLCVCPTGYADLNFNVQPGQICRDINECLLGASVCDGGTCVNTIGSFTCQ